MSKGEDFLKLLDESSWEYIEECLANTREMLSNQGNIKQIKDRHIPTIQYFLNIWMPKEKSETIHRDTWYSWLNQESETDPLAEKKSALIKKIDTLFNSLGEDIVANEGKGIFYAKNKYNMTDRMKVSEDLKILNVDPLGDEADDSAA